MIFSQHPIIQIAYNFYLCQIYSTFKLFICAVSSLEVFVLILICFFRLSAPLCSFSSNFIFQYLTSTIVQRYLAETIYCSLAYKAVDCWSYEGWLIDFLKNQFNLCNKKFLRLLLKFSFSLNFPSLQFFCFVTFN